MVRLIKNAKLYPRSKVNLFHGSCVFLQTLWNLLISNAAPRKNEEKQYVVQRIVVRSLQKQ
jgi:hypothetical protein